MKKILGLALLAMTAFGGSAAFAAECAGPASVDCDVTNADGSTTHCLVFIDADSDADGCYNA